MNLGNVWAGTIYNFVHGNLANNIIYLAARKIVVAGKRFGFFMTQPAELIRRIEDQGTDDQ